MLLNPTEPYILQHQIIQDSVQMHTDWVEIWVEMQPRRLLVDLKTAVIKQAMSE